MIPLDREARNGPQEVGFAPVAGQMLDRLVDEEARLLPRAFLAEERHKGCLPSVCIFPRGLARRGLVPAMVDEVVGDLERQSNVAGVAAIWRTGLGLHLVHNAGGIDGIFDEGT